ncbi:unnamed protein product [Adineta steineri]|uniref:Methyltransferase type 11 domain-containing protein n=1 Tax=Adineta steineri TaxID=433720 RepID=A0A816BZS4_9BILA|nr:unnamed protein product [Adineta steineri]CAF1616488.1 unnamed protein product [Adineta steineri]
MQNNIIVQPMSSVTGFVASKMIIDGEEHKSLPSDISIVQSNRSFYIWHKIYQVFAKVTLTDKNVLEINCGSGAGAAWCIHTHAFHSYIGIDPSQDVINLCQRLYSTVPRLSFVVADATKHLPFENESIDSILCIETTHAFGESIAITQFANEVVRVLRPNGYLLWCDFCYMNGSDTSIYDLIANNDLIIEEKINITKNVLHALDI